MSSVNNRVGYRFDQVDRTGGTGDNQIKLEGLKEPSAFMDDRSEDEAAEVGEGSGREKTDKELMGTVLGISARGEWDSC